MVLYQHIVYFLIIPGPAQGQAEESVYREVIVSPRVGLCDHPIP